MLKRLLPLVLCACGQSGTLAIGLVLPDDRLPVGTAQARVTLDNPAQTQTVAVTSGGSISLSLEFDSSSSSTGIVTVELLDAAGAVLSHGQSPPVSLDASNDVVKIFVAPPGQFAAAPFDLPARADLGVARLSYGAYFGGGRDASGQKVAASGIFSAYQQVLTAGADLPSPRSGLVATGSSTDFVWLFGGLGTGDAATGDLWQFDTTAPPAGTYTTVTSVPALARSGSVAAPLAVDQFLVTGNPPAVLNASTGAVAAFANAPASAAQATAAATTVMGSTGVVILAGPSGLFRYDAGADTWTTLDATDRTGAAAVTLSDGNVLVAAQGASTLVAPDGTLTPGPSVSFRDRAAAGLAGTTVVLAGGFDEAGTGRADADVIAGSTVTTVPLSAPRGGAQAVSLPNATVLVVGGRDRDGGTPQAGAEVFTF